MGRAHRDRAAGAGTGDSISECRALYVGQTWRAVPHHLLGAGKRTSTLVLRPKSGDGDNRAPRLAVVSDSEAATRLTALTFDIKMTDPKAGRSDGLSRAMLAYMRGHSRRIGRATAMSDLPMIAGLQCTGARRDGSWRHAALRVIAAHLRLFPQHRSEHGIAACRRCRRPEGG
jgi:hypothetical protein